MNTRRRLASALLVTGLCLVAQAPAGPTLQAQPGDDSVALAEVMLTRLNEARRDSGLAPYRVNPILTQIAFEHAREIATHAHYSHTGRDGRRAKDRAQDAGYGAGRQNLRIGENFVGRQHLDDGFQWLMDDPPHRANMLDPNYREVGVGAARISYGYIWVLDFGSYDGIDAALAQPPSATPAPTEVPSATPSPAPTEMPTEVPSATPSPTDRPSPSPSEVSAIGTAAGASAGSSTAEAGATGSSSDASARTAAAPGTGEDPESGSGDGADAGGSTGEGDPSAASASAARRWGPWLLLLVLGLAGLVAWRGRRA